MTAYYNEFDPYAAQWLRNLIAAGHIAPGDVDERSIEDVRPNDIRGYTQCHFFAGIGVWSRALRNIGFPDSARIWTGSCPCQPFSAAGKGNGIDDERHLWPAFHHLILACEPERVAGEQVASKDGLAWLDIVSTDMEAARFAFRAVDFCAAGVGSPNIRQRLYWMANTDGTSPARHRSDGREIQAPTGLQYGFAHSGGIGLVADPSHEGFQVGSLRYDGRGIVRDQGAPVASCILRNGLELGGVCEPDRPRPFEGISTGTPARHRNSFIATGGLNRPGPTNGRWEDVDWLYGRDGKWRPVEPGTFPLAHGATSRVGRLRAYGNAINLSQAEIFLEAALT